MKVTVWYWVNHYEKELGWKHGDIVDITWERITELAETYDVAIMTSRTYDEVTKKRGEIKLLAIDEKYRQFRQR